MYQPIEVVFTDARSYDGNPYEVAAQAVDTALGLLDVLDKAVEVADLMARNAYMERNLALNLPAAGDAWAVAPEGQLWAAQKRDLAEIRRKMKPLRMAASFDPKHPPRTDT